jgi:hypothetical protein
MGIPNLYIGSADDYLSVSHGVSEPIHSIHDSRMCFRYLRELLVRLEKPRIRRFESILSSSPY